MKLIKKANGKATIKISENEWVNIGQKTGWNKQANIGSSELVSGLTGGVVTILIKIMQSFLSGEINKSNLFIYNSFKKAGLIQHFNQNIMNKYEESCQKRNKNNSSESI